MTASHVHLQHLHRDGPTCAKVIEAGPESYVSEDVDEVTCEDCLVAVIRDAGPVAVQAYVIRLGELSLQKRHPQIYLEMEGLGQVSKVNAEIRAELAAAREHDMLVHEVDLSVFESWREQRKLPATPEVMQQWLSEAAGTQVTMHQVVSRPQKMGKPSMMSTAGLSLPMPDLSEEAEEVHARLAGYVWIHGKDQGDFEGRECALQRRGGWAIIKEARAIGLMAKGFCALEHVIPMEKIRELGGYIDRPQTLGEQLGLTLGQTVVEDLADLTCTCGAVEVSGPPNHLKPCPLSFKRGLCPRCGRPIVLASFTELGFYEPDVDVDNDPVVWRHAYSGYGACGDMMGFASDPNEKPNLTGLVSSEPAPPPIKKYGHDREGRDCGPEICGGTRFDPCDYSPEDIARFEAEAEAEDEATRGTRGVPLMLDLPDDVTITLDAAGMSARFLNMDHVHRSSDGRCVKIRFGRACTAVHDHAQGSSCLPGFCRANASDKVHENPDGDWSGNWERTVEKIYMPGEDRPTTFVGEPRQVPGRDAEVVTSMPGTGPCPCGGQYDAFGKCTSCGKVD